MRAITAINFLPTQQTIAALSQVTLMVGGMVLFSNQVMAAPAAAVSNQLVAQALLAANTAKITPVIDERARLQDAQDGGEVEVDGGEIPPDVQVGSVNTPLPNPPASVNVPTITQMPTATPDIPDAGQISQVPLGAVSPATVAKFVKTVDVVRQEYVKNVDDELLFNQAMMGMLTGLDPYSEYLDSQAFENLRLFTEGDVGSIGVSVAFDSQQRAWVFTEVLPNSPAAKVGIQRGNYLHQINDVKLLDDQTQLDVDQLLSGIAGTQVRLVVSDRGRRKHTVTVQRNLVQQQALNAKVQQGIAIIQIPIFQNNTQQQLLAALAKLKQPFSAIILDVRNNPGGVLSAANDVASLFMKNRPVAQVRGRQGLQEVIKTYGEARFDQVPLAVLQNRYSASAAEVLSNSLQENGRAKVYGDVSYGKGSIQSIVPINDNEAVKLTVAHYYSGLGKKIDGVGVRPDVALSGSELEWENQVVSQVLTLPRPMAYRLSSTALTPQEF